MKVKLGDGEDGHAAAARRFRHEGSAPGVGVALRPQRVPVGGVVLDGELSVEDDTAYWYPLWPEGNAHPWG